MEHIDHFHESYSDTQERIDRMSRQSRAALESGEFPEQFLQDLNDRHRQIYNECSLENFEKFSSFIGATKSVGRASISNVSKLMERIKIAFDRTGAVALQRATRRLSETEGDVTPGLTLENKSLAKQLHVAGQVPKDLKRPMVEAIAIAKHIRTNAVPEMERAVTRVSNVVFGPTPRSTEDCNRLVAKVMSETALAKTILDFYTDAELLYDYPGGMTLCRRDGDHISIPDNVKVTDKDSLAVQRKLESINARRLALAAHPSWGRKKPVNLRVTMPTHAEATILLEHAEKLIAEGRALTEMSKVFRSYPASSVAETISYMLNELKGEIVHDATHDRYYDTGIHVDSDDLTRLSWASSFYGASVTQHHLMLPAMATILYNMAQGYIALVEESMKHYR